MISALNLPQSDKPLHNFAFGSCGGTLAIMLPPSCDTGFAAMGLDLGAVEITADSHFDARGTLGLDRNVDVGVAPVTLTATVETELDDVTLARLATATERYCVVGQSLKHPPTIVVRHRQE